MYEIKILCTAMFMFCEQPPEFKAFDTLAECERVLLHIIHEWKPLDGSYTFNCRRVGRPA